MPVTIAIPFYNAEKFLADAIRSVFAQTYTDWELLLLDDGSTDGSLEIARSIKDSRVRVISDGKNMKLAARLNQIVELAKYDLIARMDADDLMSPTRIEKQVKYLENNTKTDLVSTGLISITDDLRIIGCRWHHNSTITLKELLYQKGCGVVHAAILARKGWHKRNPYNESLKVAQDYELWISAKYNNDFNIHLIQEPLYFYREEGNINIVKMRLARINERKLYRKYGKKYIIPLLMKSYSKSFIKKTLNDLNLLTILLKRRNSKIDNPITTQIFYDEIKIISNTSVPGLNNYFLAHVD